MTTRDQVRRAAGSERDTRAPAGDVAPGLPERLLAARERKGVDLYRAERDTKIRARYLAALERGDYRELPGAVYTKGFLRNYALYLGLDPDEVLLQWRRERGAPTEPQAVIAVPRPIAAPRRGLTFSPSLIVFALLVALVIGFMVWLGFQLLRFSNPPTIAVTNPAVAVLDVDEDTTSYLLEGTTIPAGSVTVKTADVESRTNADSEGQWELKVDLRRGENHFRITATDPETGKQAEAPVERVITVPFRVIEAPTLTVDQPADGATFENGAIPIQGRTTNAGTVVVTAEYLGPATTGGKGPTPPPPAKPAPVSVKVDEDGTFNAPLELTTGKWKITTTASSPEGKTTSLARAVTVAFKGVNLVISIDGGRAWLKVWVDGKLDPKTGAAGKVLGDGKTLTFTGKESIEVRTGSSGVTKFTLNGVPLGSLGKSGTPETWLFAPPDQPVMTQRR